MSTWPAIADIAASVQAGKTTASDNVNKSLKLVADQTQYKAIIATTEHRAKERAQIIDEQIKQGHKVGRLAGVPFIVKDNFLVLGANTTAASNMLKNFDTPYQATSVDKLEAEGAICVAKANLDAFAHGSSTENSDFFTTLNPHDKTRVPGGSSGGSAAAVALDMTPFALGTDTGGSIRLPASFCGVVGYKPTYGLVSRSGVIAMASSTDVIGPLTNNIQDTALVLDVMSGKDSLDSTTIDKDKSGYTGLAGSIKGKKIGVVSQYMDHGLDKDVKRQINQVIEKLKAAGAQINTVNLPSLELSLAAYYIIVPAEISSNLSRYDGQRYGLSRQKDADTLIDVYEQARSSGFNDENKRRIMIGTYVLSSGYYDAYYKKAQTVRTKLIDEFNDVFKKVDFLLSPTAPTTAFKIGQHTSPLQMYLTDIMTVAANLTGIPAVSIPVDESAGLPVGLQLMAPQKHDRQLLELAEQTEGLV